MARILVVEDDRDVRMLMEHVLFRDRYDVDAVGTAAAARALLGRASYDLVVTDGLLPDGTGLDIAEEAQQLSTPAIIITAYGFLLPKDRLARFPFLLKPVRPAELLAAIERMLERNSVNPPVTGRD